MERTTVKELVSGTAMKAHTTQKQARKVIYALIDEMRVQLQHDKYVSLFEFGTLKPVTRKARKGHHPVTGETIMIPAKRTVTFKPSKILDLYMSVKPKD